MSLFGDLPQAKTNDAGGSAWAGVNKLAPPPRKPAPAFGPPLSVLRAGRGGGRMPLNPGRGAGRGPIGTPTPSGDSSADPSLLAAPATASVVSIFASSGHIQDEYDPSRPNDYEQIIAERERRKREAQEEADRQAALKEQEEEIRARKEAAVKAAAAIAARLASQAPADAAGEPPASAPAAPSGGPAAGPEAAAAAGPVSDEERRRALLSLSGEEAFRRRGMLNRPLPQQPSGTTSTSGGLPGLPGGLPGLSGYDDDEQEPAFGGAGLGSASASSSNGAGGAGGVKGMSLAERMLKKMGWTEGRGLGKHEQGIATPLVAQKVAAGAGVIVAASDMGPPEKRPRTGAVLQGKPSRVVVLRNAVGPGQVDDDLEDEMGEELSKYGKVTDVVIFEVTQPGFPPEEAVRVFIQFERLECATKAVVDLQGRFFAGRQLRVAFFDETRFEKSDLAPSPGEFD